MLDRHDELGRLFNVTHCNEFVYIPSGHSIADYDVVEAHDEDELKNWLFEHLHADVVIENDLPFDVEILWEGSPRDVSLLTIPSGKMETIHTYISHHLVVRRNSNNKRLLRLQVEGEKTYLMSQYVSSEITRVCVDEEICHDMNDAIIQVNNKVHTESIALYTVCVKLLTSCGSPITLFENRRWIFGVEGRTRIRQGFCGMKNSL